MWKLRPNYEIENLFFFNLIRNNLLIQTTGELLGSLFTDFIDVIIK